MSSDVEWVKGECPQCGNVGDLSLMDFGPYRGHMICDGCWDETPNGF
jgi:hypothetical protein